MDREKLLSHIENLAPGFVTLGILAARVPADHVLVLNTGILAVLQQQFVVAVLATAFAYLIGVLTFLVSRLAIDTLSAWTFRPVLLKAYRWEDFPRFNPSGINRQYRAALDAARRRPLEDATRREVERRRVRGRLIRACAVPLTLLLWPVAGPSTTLLVLLALVGVYAYAEVATYQEARLAT